MNLSLVLFPSFFISMLTSIVCLLAVYGPIFLFYSLCIGTVAFLYMFTQQDVHSLLEWMGLIKMIALIPLGLLIVVGFGLLSANQKERLLARFTIFINAAVLGNILMMMVTPVAGTVRGFICKVICLLLGVWLLQEMLKLKGRTVSYEGSFFLFKASPLSWVLSHGVYRFILLTLPSFDNRHYLLLEPLSLGMMLLLWKLHHRRYPIHYYFGFSDTLVVACVAFASRILHALGYSSVQESALPTYGNELDLAMAAVLLAIGSFVIGKIAQNWRLTCRGMTSR